MKFQTVLAALVAVSLATLTGAQTKMAGTVRCLPGDPEHMIEIGDVPNHVYTISKSQCTWVKPMVIDGVENTKGYSVSADETIGNESTFSGYHIDTMANGDQAHYRYTGKMMLKDGQPVSGKNEWTIFRGTGKLKGIKGKGSCKGEFSPDSPIIWDCVGEYTKPSS